MALSNSLYDDPDLAAQYAAATAGNIWNAAYERPAMRALCGDVAGLDLLDAGCAAGEHSAFFAGAGARVIAIDASPAMVALARERIATRARILQADLEAPLPVATGSIDLIVSSLALHYLASWSTPLREFRRILRIGGRFVFSTHHPHTTAADGLPYRTVRRIDETWSSVAERPVPVSFFHRSFEAIVDELKAGGFAIARIVEPGPSDELAAQHPEIAARLGARPAFVLFEAAPR